MQQIDSRALVVLSGGQDSTTCLFWAKQRYKEVLAITFNYSQRHSTEIVAAQKIAELAGVQHDIVSVPNVLEGTSPLINPDHEVESYGSVSDLPGGLEKTFVPGRNMLFLIVAANRAYVNNCSVIITGVSQEDFGGYPDCRRLFIDSIIETINLGLDRYIDIVTPLINLTKRETVLLANHLGEDCWQALSCSHTCYNGEIPPCGKCHACLLRQKGFDEAGFVDPLLSGKGKGK